MLYEKNFQEKVDSIKKLTNIWLSRGLSIYGKVTIIKSLLIPKLVFISSVLSPPSKIIKQVNSMIFSFLWNVKDKVTRLSSISSYEDGGIKMTDIESLVKTVRLALPKRIFSDNESTWKFYLSHLLPDVGGLLLFKCNYAMNDLSVKSVFYRELLECWLEFILGDPGAVSRVGRKGATKVFKNGRKSPWLPTLPEPFPKIQADAGY